MGDLYVDTWVERVITCIIGHAKYLDWALYLANIE